MVGAFVDPARNTFLARRVFGQHASGSPIGEVHPDQEYQAAHSMLIDLSPLHGSGTGTCGEDYHHSRADHGEPPASAGGTY